MNRNSVRILAGLLSLFSLAGSAYGIPTIIDDGLLGLGDIYFEGGDHVDLVHMDGADFFSLIPDGNHADLTA